MGAGGAGTVENGSASHFKLVGAKQFVRNNPRSDKFPMHRFHHVEFWCSDATNVYKRFQHGLGMSLVAKSDQSTGNSTFASYVLRSHDLVFTFTAPYSKTVAANSSPGSVPLPYFSQDKAYDFMVKHGLAVRSMGLVVDDAAQAFEVSVKHGAIPAHAPITLEGTAADGSRVQQVVSEVVLYGDVVLRYISGDVHDQQKVPYLAGYTSVTPTNPDFSYGIRRLDHAVGNVHVLEKAANYIMNFTGFHEFAEFVAEDVGTLDSGLNSVVLANNNEYVLLPINEPTFGTPRKSQIQTYLEQNEGPGLQHMALKTDDIFATLREMQARSEVGGFEFMPRPSDKYYKELPNKVGAALTPDQLAECEKLGVLVDKDDQGILLQIFTKPLGDRPTIFIEIIQRLGCLPKSHPAPAAALSTTEPTAPTATSTAAATTAETVADTTAKSDAAETAATETAPTNPDIKLVDSDHLGPANEPQAAGCGGFGKGNFSELFKRIEDYERTLNV